MRSMSILEEILEIIATTVQAELKATLHVCESGIFLGLVPKESPCIIEVKKRDKITKLFGFVRSIYRIEAALRFFTKLNSY
jgi:hypothetical protein